MDQKIRKAIKSQRKGAYVDISSKVIREKEKANKVLPFSDDFKIRLFYTQETKLAITEDKSDEEIIALMMPFLENYITEEMSIQSYEQLLNRYVSNGILKEKGKELYPNKESIEEDFRKKMQQEIQQYARKWIGHFRILFLLERKTNSTIANKVRGSHNSEAILNYIIQKNPNVDNMPNLKKALIEKIEDMIYKYELSKKQGEKNKSE